MNIIEGKHGLKISNSLLNLSGPVIITSFKQLNNLIADCDEVSKNVIKSAFAKFEVNNDLFFIENIDDEEKENDFSTLNGPEVHNIGQDDEENENVQSIFNSDSDTYTTVNSSFTVDSSKLGDVSAYSNEYVVDPSWNVDKVDSSLDENKPLLSRLKEIEPIFVDEERILDKNLNVYNAISLGKIVKRNLVVKQNPLYINVKESTILEMNDILHNTFRKICSACNKKVPKYLINDGDNRKFSFKSGTLLAEMPSNLLNKIRKGTLKVKETGINMTDSFIIKKDQLVDQLKQVRNILSTSLDNEKDTSVDVSKTL